MSKFRFYSSIIVLCMALILCFSKLALADGSSADSSGGSGTTKGSHPVAAKNNGASEDDQKKQKGVENGFPEVDPTGAFQYKYPLNLPPGTHGMAPSLSLFYNSNSPNGMVGMGWNLNGIFKVERDYAYPVTYNDSTDHFMFNGEKLVKDSNGYYHPAKESYERIEFINQNSGSSYWVITQKNGTKLFFGYQAAEHTSTTHGGRIQGLNITGSDTAVVWSLSKVVDLQMNYYVIEYTTDGTTGAYYPIRITYTKNENHAILYTRTVDFLYINRTDHSVVYNPTYTDMQQRLRWVIVKMNGQLLRAYRLDYTYATSTGRSRLYAIQEYGNDATLPSSFPYCDPGFPATGRTLPKLFFNWQEGPAGTFSSVSSLNINDSSSQIFSFDYNGDGKEDLCIFSTVNNKISILKSDGDGTYTSAYYSTSGIAGFNLHDYKKGFPLDCNGDGRMDLCFYNAGSGRIAIATSGLDDNFSSAYSSSSGVAGFDLSNTSDEVFPLDHNGDGRMDLCLFRPSTGLTTIAKSNGDGTYTSVYSSSSGVGDFQFGSSKIGYFRLTIMAMA